MSSEHYKFFNHGECEFFPCHKGLEDDEFNCLFCYCPLYFLGDKCGGSFKITGSGVKDCTDCLFPHRKENYEKMMEKIRGFMREEAEKRKKDTEK